MADPHLYDGADAAFARSTADEALRKQKSLEKRMDRLERLVVLRIMYPGTSIEVGELVHEILAEMKALGKG